MASAWIITYVVHIDLAMFHIWTWPTANLWSSLVEGDEVCVDPSGELLALPPKKVYSIQLMYGNIPYMFDGWADPVVLLKTSMANPKR